ncbi:hypothetical protein DYB37_013519 [Aphanomyces astaci]|uniref:Uncharacterized protein n=1 Tax=Aphanomyces astaci TaxID=112090 RepID=A0A3R6XWB1_APHAT|nr:hypothetical protein DYB37_013519 [Aphanomyces astaci]
MFEYSWLVHRIKALVVVAPRPSLSDQPTTIIPESSYPLLLEQPSQDAYVLAPLAVRWKLLIPGLTERCVYVSMLLDQLGTMSPVGLVQIMSNFIDLSVVSAGRKNVLVLLFTVWAADSGIYFT